MQNYFCILNRQEIQYENEMDSFYFLLNDRVIFPIFEIAFIGLCIFAFLRERGWFAKKSSVVATVKRGEESWKKFNLAFGIASVVLMQIINSANFLKGYKTIISIFDLSMLIYLAFFNSWFRNKTIWLIAKSQQKEES